MTDHSNRHCEAEGRGNLDSWANDRRVAEPSGRWLRPTRLPRFARNDSRGRFAMTEKGGRAASCA